MIRLEPALAHLADHAAAVVGLPGTSLAARGATFAWERWLELAHEHDLAPLLGARALRPDAPGRAALPAEVVVDLRAAYARWAHETVFRAAELRAVLDALAPVGGAIVLKGPAVAATSYDELAERRSTDLDLLVRDGDARRRGVELLAARGYARKHARDAAAEDAAHDLGLVSEVADLEVDLHVDLLRSRLPRAALDDAWATRRELPVLGGIAVLDPAWQALHAAVHALSDPIGSPLLRNLLETGMLVVRLDVAGRARFVERARRFGLEDRVARALGLAHRLFGSPALLPVPRPGARELWAWRRLRWRYDDEGVVGRTLAHVAEHHLRRLDARLDHGLGVRALAGTLVEVARGHVVRRVTGTAAPRFLAAAATARAIGDALLVHAHATGDVHVVRGDAITAWQLVTSSAAPATLAALRDRLVAGGLAPDRADAALAALDAAALLVTGA